MKQERFYRIVIVLLLLLNGGILFYLLSGRNDHEGPRHMRPDQLITERLHLDEQQRAQFEILRHEHHSQMLEITETSSGLHQQLFSLLKQDIPDEQQKDSLLMAIQKVDLQKELVTYDHFSKLRKILRPDQLPLFDDLVTDIGMRIMGPHKKD